MKIETLKVRCIFTQNILGTANNNKDVHAEYIASKAPSAQKAEEELAAISPADELAKQKTVFHRTKEGRPCLLDYQVRGFFKQTLGILVKLGDLPVEQCSFTGVREAVDTRLFIKERFVPFLMPFSNSAVEDFTRPLRAETAQGPRVALATSESLPETTTIEFTIELLCGAPTSGKKKANSITLVDLRAALDYGARVGFGQWRTGGFGRFVWEELAT